MNGTGDPITQPGTEHVKIFNKNLELVGVTDWSHKHSEATEMEEKRLVTEEMTAELNKLNNVTNLLDGSAAQLLDTCGPSKPLRQFSEWFICTTCPITYPD